MGQLTSKVRQIYWLSRFLDTMPEPPAKNIKFEDLTDEQRIARYAHRAYYILTGEKFDKNIGPAYREWAAVDFPSPVQRQRVRFLT